MHEEMAEIIELPGDVPHFLVESDFNHFPLMSPEGTNLDCFDGEIRPMFSASTVTTERVEYEQTEINTERGSSEDHSTITDEKGKRIQREKIIAKIAESF